jgi:2-dehydro-3-deoxygluconokinase
VSADRDFDVVTLGEPLAVFAADRPGPLDEARHFSRFCAGAELNVAIGLARLGYRVGYLSRVGDDSLGRFLRRCMEEEGVRTELLETTAAHRTGFMLKSRAVDGEDPQIEYHRAGSAASTLDRRDLDRLGRARARHLHLTGIAPALSPGCRDLVLGAARMARARGMTISFDPNLRPALWPSVQEMRDTLNELAALADLVLPGLAEGQVLTGARHAPEIAEFYLRRGARQVAVKLGPGGAWWADAEGRSGPVAGVAVERVVDTVGAGDGFAVGVVSGLLEGLGLERAVARGNRIGARVVQFPGDSDGLPRRSELGSPE